MAICALNFEATTECIHKDDSQIRDLSMSTLYAEYIARICDDY